MLAVVAKGFHVFFSDIVFRIVPRIASLRQPPLLDLSLLNFGIIRAYSGPSLRDRGLRRYHGSDLQTEGNEGSEDFLTTNEHEFTRIKKGRTICEKLVSIRVRG